MKVEDVRIMGRATQGVRLINLEKRNDQIGSVCKVESESEEELTEEIVEGEDILTIEPLEDMNSEENNNEESNN